MPTIAESVHPSVCHALTSKHPVAHLIYNHSPSLAYKVTDTHTNTNTQTNPHPHTRTPTHTHSQTHTNTRTRVFTHPYYPTHTHTPTHYFPHNLTQTHSHPSLPKQTIARRVREQLKNRGDADERSEIFDVCFIIVSDLERI
jgi:hypothetical protein